MRMDDRNEENSLYTTWYEFRRALGTELGYTPLNRQWLEAKPKTPLPWDDSHMRAALAGIVRREGQKIVQKRGRSKQKMPVT